MADRPGVCARRSCRTVWAEGLGAQAAPRSHPVALLHARVAVRSTPARPQGAGSPDPVQPLRWHSRLAAAARGTPTPSLRATGALRQLAPVGTHRDVRGLPTVVDSPAEGLWVVPGSRNDCAPARASGCWATVAPGAARGPRMFHVEHAGVMRMFHVEHPVAKGAQHERWTWSDGPCHPATGQGRCRMRCRRLHDCPSTTRPDDQPHHYPGPTRAGPLRRAGSLSRALAGAPDAPAQDV